jgi:nucleoside-diphosphate-sugar epimerase
MGSTKTKENVVITGSGGLIGTRVCNLLKADCRVIGIDRSPPAKPVPGVEWIGCDLTDDESVVKAFDDVAERTDGDIASVIHLAAYYDFSGAESPLYRDLTVEGTRRLLQQLQPLEVRQFVFSSTLLVMQPAEEGETIEEDSPTHGPWAYPKSKLAAERVIREEHGHIPAVILRIAGVYDEDCNSIPLSQQIRRIYEKDCESYFFPGDPDHGQPFVHLDDLALCFRKVVEMRESLAPYEVFLIAEDSLISYEDLQDRIGQLLHGEEWYTIRIPKVVAKAGAWVKDKLGADEFIKPWMIDLADDHYPVDIAKAQERLGWHPKHRLYDTLAEMSARLKLDRRRWYEINRLGAPPEDIWPTVAQGPAKAREAGARR